jgi:N-terminal acetyltransferase B complex non-catalytic subunit
LRYNLRTPDLTIEAESARVALYTQQYLEGLKLGADLPSTELQVADDLVILAGNVLVNIWKLTSDENYLFKAVTLLEFALTKSKQSFQARLILIRLYRLLGKDLLHLTCLQVLKAFVQVRHHWLWSITVP